MKKLVILIVIILASAGAMFLSSRAPNPPQTMPDPLPTPAVEPVVPSFTSPGGDKVDWLIVRDMEKLKLYSNLADQKSSKDIVKEKGCTSLVSGSFYSRENIHLGLFIEDNVSISPSIESSFFNGFFGMADKYPFIGNAEPGDVRFAIQSGPLLLKNGLIQNFRIENDEPARRLVVSTLTNGNIVFLVFYNQNSQFLGPELENVPALLKDLEKSTSLRFKDALNLDGGSASAFLTESTKLPELSRIGSYFCIK